MNEDKYLAESGGFDGDSFHTELVSYAKFDAMLGIVSDITMWADSVKKALFYGSPLPRTGDIASSMLKLDPKHRDLIHGILGLFTEAGELMDQLKNVLMGAELDTVNVLEELGDCYWYMAVLHRLTGSKPSEAWATNIAKLTRRYPEKFTEYHANNRDLDGERKVLERVFVDENDYAFDVLTD